MYCLLESTQLGSHIPHWMAKDQYQSLRMILMKAQNVRDVVELFSFLEEAIDDLKIWCESTETYGEYLIRNKHAAERRCRGVLLELTTYLDQMEKLLLKNMAKIQIVVPFSLQRRTMRKVNV